MENSNNVNVWGHTLGTGIVDAGTQDDLVASTVGRDRVDGFTTLACAQREMSALEREN
jgi:hypothetical protein